MLRSASRFWLHVNDKNQAHDILIRSERTAHDPWLMSAEIAVGIQVKAKPIFAQKAHAIISDQTFPEFHVSELAASVATIDWQHGLIKEAQKLFDKSLTEPTENSLAQVAWVASKDNSIHLNEDLLSLNNTYEAQARNFCLDGDWRAAAQQCNLWQFDQPFSIDPALEGSFISIVALEDFHLAKQFALTGLVANHNEPILLNNLAVAHIYLNEIKDAQTILSQINLSEYKDDAQRTITQITKLATTGLLHYRTGNIEQGRQCYQAARTLAKTVTHSGSDIVARATAIHAIEEFPYQINHHHHHHHHHHLTKEALELLEHQTDPSCKILKKNFSI